MAVDHIEDKEMLYRVVRNSYPDGFINDEPTAALFMDEKGVSVERDGKRNEDDIIKNLRNRFSKADDYKASVKICAGACRTIGTFPIAINNKKNKYHAEIHESPQEVKVSLLKALQLARQCEVVK